MQKLSSRMRMLRALDRQEIDHVPCCFMSFTALRERCDDDMFRLTEAELGMGLDSMLFIPTLPRRERYEHPYLRGLPVQFHPEVEIREWKEGSPDHTTLHKEYVTPAGSLFCSAHLSDDWPHGDHVPLLDDYQIPRAISPVITGPEDLDALQFLLTPPHREDIAAFENEKQKALQFSEEHGVLLAGGWGVGVDMAFWLCGMQNFMMAMLQQPQYAGQLLEMIHHWNMRRMHVVLSTPVDLYIRRAWYEGCDFVSPRTFKNLVLPFLKAEADLAHEYGARFGYICTSGLDPLLDLLLEAGIDVLIGVDPVQGSYVDMPLIKEKIGGRICLWGGVSGAITVEMGTEGEVRAAVQEAVQTLGPTGFVLSPIDNITVDAPRTWDNLSVFIDEWQKHW
jgi:uroporphyrinogen-III decarboxylase